MGKAIDLTGMKFGRLTVLERDMTKPIGHQKPVYWVCQCECGKIKVVRGANLKNGHTQSCGCLRIENLRDTIRENLAGQIFGKLTVLEIDKNKQNSSWLCRCECGQIISVLTENLKKGRTKSCGCMKSDYIREGLTIDLSNKKFGKLLVLERDLDKKDCTYWRCQCDCGKILSIRGDSLKNGQKSCGCLRSKGEQKIKEILTLLELEFKEQYYFFDLKGKERYLRFDFAIFNDEQLYCLIEYQGKQHYNNIEYFGGEVEFLQRQSYDSLKRQYCKHNNIQLIEIPYWDYDKLSEEYILERLNILKEEKE